MKSLLILFITFIAFSHLLPAKEIDLTLPPIEFIKTTSLMNEALATSINSEKINLINSMSDGLYNLPPCKIHTANAIYTVALSGNDEVKNAAIKLLDAALGATSNNLPLPSFICAKEMMINYKNAIKNLLSID